VEALSGLLALLRDALPWLLRGTGYTLLFAVASMVLGLMLGALIAVVRIARVPVLSRIAVLYVSCMRGTPLLVQVFVIYYGLPSVGIRFDPITAGILALTLNVAAYLSESMRGAVAAIPRGQWNAALSLGLDRRQTMRYVIAPQALRVAVPSLSNSLISLVKDTSLVSVIGVTELMLASKEVISTTFRPLPLYLAAAAIYWGLSLVFERAQGGLERRLNRPHEAIAR
jgi:cystine transport system permease protein